MLEPEAASTLFAVPLVTAGFRTNGNGVPRNEPSPKGSDSTIMLWNSSSGPRIRPASLAAGRCAQALWSRALGGVVRRRPGCCQLK